MPAWLVDVLKSVLLPLAVTLLTKWALPALEADFPFLVPLINAILSFLNPKNANEVLHPAVTEAAKTYNSVVGNKL